MKIYYSLQNRLERFGHQRIALSLSLLIIILGLLGTLYARYPFNDELIYLQETSRIAWLLRHGQWIGNYGVGLHGFISKLPVALIFLITGPSIAVATMFNVVLNALSSYLFYKIQVKHFKFGWWSLAGCALFVFNHQFITTSLSFLRDPAAVLIMLIILDRLLSKANYWITGIFLMLLLDAKEHVFLTVAPAIFMGTVLEVFMTNKTEIFAAIKQFFIKNLAFWIFPLLLIVLMLFTSLVPINMYVAQVLYVTQEKEVQSSSILLDAPQRSRSVPVGTKIIRNVLEQNAIVNSRYRSQISNFIQRLTRLVTPRTFGFLSLPYTIVIASLATSIFFFIKWIKERNVSLVTLNLILYFNLFFYITRDMHGRYLLPLYPIILIFFILFLREIQNKKLMRTVLIVTAVFLALCIPFEFNYPLQKSIIYLVTFGCLAIFLLVKNKGNELKRVALIIMTLTMVIAHSSAAVVYLQSKSTQGQVFFARAFGPNMQSKEISTYINPNDVVWVNDRDLASFLNFYKNMDNLNTEWNWDLKLILAKKQWIKNNDTPKILTFDWDDPNNVRTQIQKQRINKIVIIEAAPATQLKFPRQDYLNQIQNILDESQIKSWKKVYMQNKYVHIIEI